MPRENDAQRRGSGERDRRLAAVVDDEDDDLVLGGSAGELMQGRKQAIALLKRWHEHRNSHDAPILPCDAPPPLEPVVWLNGSFVAAADARVSIFDRGYQLGEGVFATMHAYRGRCFRAGRHLAQLDLGAKTLGLSVPPGLLEHLNEAATRVAAPEARVRVTVTDTTTSIVAEPLVPPPPEQYVHGIAAVIVSRRRTQMWKLTSYAPQVLARKEATERGADEAIQLGLDGAVSCGAMANLFVVRGHELATPSLDSGCRPGITRETILQLASEVGLTPKQRRIEPDELFAADEAFFTNTRIEALPIATIDGRAIRRGTSGDSPYTFALRNELRKAAGA